PGAEALDARAEGGHGGRRSLHVLALQQPLDFGRAGGERRQDQRPVGDGFVAGSPYAALQGTCGPGGQGRRHHMKNRASTAVSKQEGDCFDSGLPAWQGTPLSETPPPYREPLFWPIRNCAPNRAARIAKPSSTTSASARRIAPSARPSSILTKRPATAASAPAPSPRTPRPTTNASTRSW